MATLAEKEQVIVGLGNPGKRYALTRHNIGAMVIEALAKQLGWVFKSVKKVDAKVAKGIVGETMLHLVIPELFMNESGRAVRGYLDYFGPRPHHLAIVVDDIALPFGMLRLRSGGSSGGHNGLKSIQSSVATQDYVRLRVGIGDKREGPLADHVLSKFNKQEMEQLGSICSRSGDVLLRLLEEEIVDIMNDINQKVKQLPEENLAQSTQESDHDNSG